MREYISIDRFEDDFAVCINDMNEIIHLRKSLLPSNVKEGEVLFIENGQFLINKDETAKRRSEARSLFKSLMAKPLDK